MVQEGQSTTLRVDQDGLHGFADALRAAPALNTLRSSMRKLIDDGQVRTTG